MLPNEFFLYRHTALSLGRFPTPFHPTFYTFSLWNTFEEKSHILSSSTSETARVWTGFSSHNFLFNFFIRKIIFICMEFISIITRECEHNNHCTEIERTHFFLWWFLYLFVVIMDILYCWKTTFFPVVGKTIDKFVNVKINIEVLTHFKMNRVGKYLSFFCVWFFFYLTKRQQFSGIFTFNLVKIL